MHSVVMNIKRLIVLSTSLSLGLFGCSSLENLSGAEQLALSQFDDRPVLRISNYNSINGNRYIKVVEVNGEEFGSKSGYLPLDFGRNYIKVECGRNNSSVEEGARLRYSEIHHFYAEPKTSYNVEYFSRAFDMPDDVSDMRYCSTEDCPTETGSDSSGAICNVFFTNEMGAIKTYVFGQKRIF